MSRNASHRWLPPWWTRAAVAGGRLAGLVKSRHLGFVGALPGLSVPTQSRAGICPYRGTEWYLVGSFSAGRPCAGRWVVTDGLAVAPKAVDWRLVPAPRPGKRAGGRPRRVAGRLTLVMIVVAGCRLGHHLGPRACDQRFPFFFFFFFFFFFLPSFPEIHACQRPGRWRKLQQ